MRTADRDPSGCSGNTSSGDVELDLMCVTQTVIIIDTAACPYAHAGVNDLGF